MAIIHDIISQVQDAELRARLLDEYNRIAKQKKFGLVYEEHAAERTALWGVPVKKGCHVARKTGEMNDLYEVLAVADGVARCVSLVTEEETEIPVDELVVSAQFGEPVFPYLIPQGSVENYPADKLWHQLIEADNFHALQLLDYLYRGKVDCIYIDPPYNTGARDWKYNNDYVDKSDAYRHSKWLSMMVKRLRLAKRLLNPENSVLIVTIDEKEYLHLGCLLEEIFDEADIQMVSSVINPSGSSRKEKFSRSDEYIFFVFIGSSYVVKNENNMLYSVEKKSVRWHELIRGGANGRRRARPNLFYPIYFNRTTGHFVGAGESLPLNIDKQTIMPPDNCFAVFPINKNGDECTWGLQKDTFVECYNKGYIRFGRWNPQKDYRSISYLQEGMIEALENGLIEVYGNNVDGTLELGISNKALTPMTTWFQSSHSAGDYGSNLLKRIFPITRFSFPKSLYAVHDALRFFVADKPNALIVDFFAGSGTTLHAVNLLNKEDGGKRRCIMVTNNEVSEEEAAALTAKGFKPGDEEWEKLGIARYVTWPRTKCSVVGLDVNNEPIKGEYLTYLTETKTIPRKVKQLSLSIPEGRDGKALKKQIVGLLGQKQLAQSLVTDDCPFIVSEKHPVAILFEAEQSDAFIEALDGQEQVREIHVVTTDSRRFRMLKAEIEEAVGGYEETTPVTYPMQEGFRTNVEFFKLGFLDKNAVALGNQFKEILPLLWMKAGAKGERPTIKEDGFLPDILHFYENDFAVLCDTLAAEEFVEDMKCEHHEQVVFIVTDSENEYMNITHQLSGVTAYQLYRDYLDNFRINIEQ